MNLDEMGKKLDVVCSTLLVLDNRFGQLEKKVVSLEKKVSNSGVTPKIPLGPEKLQGDAEEAPSALKLRRNAKSLEGGRIQMDGSEATPWSRMIESVTGIVGLREALFSKSTFARLTWRVLFGLGVVATLFTLYQTTKEFLGDRTATKIRLASDLDYKLPEMLLCPREWFDVDKAYRLGLSRDSLCFSLLYLHDYQPNDVTDLDAAREEFMLVYERHGFRSLLDYYKAISPDLILRNETDAEDGAVGDDYSSSESTYACRGCAKPPGTTILQSSFCYTFHFDPIARHIGVYSSTRRLTITFKPNTEPIRRSTDEWYLYFNPFPDIHFSVYPMSSLRAFHTNLVVYHEQRFATMTSPVEPCIDKDPDREPSAQCMATCHNRLYREKLGCGFLWLSDAHSPPGHHCNTLNTSAFGNRSLDAFYSTSINADIDSRGVDECVKACPRECDHRMMQTEVKRQVSYSRANVESLEARNMTRITVAIKHGAVFQGGIMELTEIETYTLVQLVTNIGGTLGLFIGATLLTLAQVLIFASEYLLEKLMNSRWARTRREG